MKVHLGIPLIAGLAALQAGNCHAYTADKLHACYEAVTRLLGENCDFPAPVQRSAGGHFAVCDKLNSTSSLVAVESKQGPNKFMCVALDGEMKQFKVCRTPRDSNCLRDDAPGTYGLDFTSNPILKGRTSVTLRFGGDRKEGTSWFNASKNPLKDWRTSDGGNSVGIPDKDWRQLLSEEGTLRNRQASGQPVSTLDPFENRALKSIIREEARPNGESACRASFLGAIAEKARTSTIPRPVNSAYRLAGKYTAVSVFFGEHCSGIPNMGDFYERFYKTFPYVKRQRSPEKAPAKALGPAGGGS